MERTLGRERLQRSQQNDFEGVEPHCSPSASQPPSFTPPDEGLLTLRNDSEPFSSSCTNFTTSSAVLSQCCRPVPQLRARAIKLIPPLALLDLAPLLADLAQAALDRFPLVGKRTELLQQY